MITTRYSAAFLGLLAFCAARSDATVKQSLDGVWERRWLTQSNLSLVRDRFYDALRPELEARLDSGHDLFQFHRKNLSSLRRYPASLCTRNASRRLWAGRSPTSPR